MNAKSFVSDSTFTTLITSILDLENSNLPIDYFTSVLPRAQYGDESAVSIGSSSSVSTFKISESDPKRGALFNAGNSTTPVNDPLNRSKVASTHVGDGAFASNLITSQGGSTLVGFRGSLSPNSSSFPVT